MRMYVLVVVEHPCLGPVGPRLSVPNLTAIRLQFGSISHGGRRDRGTGGAVVAVIFYYMGGGPKVATCQKSKN